MKKNYPDNLLSKNQTTQMNQVASKAHIRVGGARYLKFLLLFFSLVLLIQKTSAQIPDTLLSDTDTNYFQITSKIDAYLNSMPAPGSGSSGSGSGGSGSGSGGSGTIEEDGWEAKYNRWKNYWESRIDNTGNFSSYYKQTDIYENNKTDSISNCNIENISESISWNCIGPFNSPINTQLQGQIDALSANPNFENEILVGNYNGGIWKTIDGGVNWVNTTDGSFSYDNQGTNCIERMPSNPNYVFANTLKNNVGRWASGRNTNNITKGIIMSNDGGSSWINIPLLSYNYEDLVIIPQIIVHPLSTPGAAFIIFVEQTKDWGSSIKIYDELNNTITELYSPTELDWKRITKMQLNPANPYLLYVTTVNDNWHTNSAKMYRKTISIFSSITSSGLIQQDFSSLNTLCSSCGFEDNYKLSYITFSFANNGQGREVLHNDIWDSTNTEITSSFDIYVRINEDLTYVAGETHVFNPGNFSRAHPFFEVSPYHDNVIYKEIGISGLDPYPCKSIDGGQTFNYIATGFGHVDTRCFKIYRSFSDDVSFNRDIIYAGNDGGISSSSNGGNNWSIINGNGLNIGEYYGLGTSEKDAKYLRAGSQDGNLDDYKNNAWTKVTYLGDLGEQIIQPDDISKYRYSGNFTYAQNWDTCGLISGENYTKNRFTLFPFTLSKVNNNLVFIGFENLHFRDESVSPYICDQVIWTNIQENHIMDVETYKDGLNDIVYVSTSGFTNDWPTPRASFEGGIWRLDKVGTSWNATEITNNLRAIDIGPLENNCQINDIAIDPLNNNNIWISLSGLYSDPTNPSIVHKVYKTIDGGANWTNYSDGLPNLPTNTIIYQNGTNDRLYLGTDIGVYYRDNNMDCWMKFGKNLPDVMVYDLDINYCGNKLSIATFGRGIWQAPLLPSNTQEVNVGGVLKFDDGLVHNIHSDIHIDENSTMIVTNNSIVNMAADKKIIIDAGGFLVVDHGTITNDCNTMWGGIVVKGKNNTKQTIATTYRPFVPYYHSDDQGYVKLNNATISNAYEAISLFNTDAPYISTKTSDPTGETGGIVQADNSSFINNRRSAAFMYYHYFDPITGVELPNISYFNNCTFSTDDDHRPEYPFHNHLSMWSVNGVNIASSVFSNDKTTTTLTDAEHMGKGIYTIDANYTVKYSGFENLTRGLEATQSSGGAINVYKTGFRNNLMGLYLNGGINSIVKTNSFETGSMTIAPPSYLTPVGAGFVGNSRYKFTNNAFVGDITKTNIGSWICNSGSDDNICIANNYKTSTYANLSNYKNRHVSTTGVVTGLQYKCNINAGNLKDFTVYSPGGSSSMGFGIRDNQGLPSEYVGNTFSTPPSADPLAHFEQRDANVKYFLPTTSTAYDPDLSKCSTAPEFTIVRNNGNSSCPIKTPPHWSNISGGAIAGMAYYSGDDYQKLNAAERTAVEANFLTHQTNYNYLSNQIKNLIDNGNTEELVEDIEATNTATQLRADLLAKSPYLSAEALKVASEQTAVLNNAVLFEILNANPDALKDQDLLEYLANKEVPLPQWMIDYLKNNPNTTPRTLLEYAISNAHEKMMIDAREILQDLQFDPDGLNHEALRYWLGELHDVEADYSIVDDYIELGNYSEAQTIMDAIPLLYKLDKYQVAEYTSMKDINDWKLEMLQNGSKTYTAMSEYEKAGLQAIADNGFGLGKYKAENILNYFANGAYVNLPILPNTENQRRANPSSTKIAEVEDYIKVYPNPARELVTIEYQLPCISQDGIITITDLLGKIVHSSKIVGERNIHNIDTKNWSNGNYLYRVVCDGIKLGEGKLSIIK